MEIFTKLPLVLRELTQDYIPLSNQVEFGEFVTPHRLTRIVETTLGETDALMELYKELGTRSVRLTESHCEGMIALTLLDELINVLNYEAFIAFVENNGAQLTQYFAAQSLGLKQLLYPKLLKAIEEGVRTTDNIAISG